MGNEKGGSSVIDDLQEFFGKFNKALESNLEKYGYSSIYGYFIAVSLASSFSIAVYFSYNDVANGVSFAADLVLFTILTALVMFPLFSIVLVHIYKAFYKTVEATKRVLSWQILVLFLSILLVFALATVQPISGGLVVFGILLFVHPLTKIAFNRHVIVGDFNSTLNKIYLVVVAIAGLVQIILKFARLM